VRFDFITAKSLKSLGVGADGIISFQIQKLFKLSQDVRDLENMGRLEP
jgi:hypothetical protein